ncbi:MAG: AMP-binding protein [Candidatus Microthrix parvicella]
MKVDLSVIDFLDRAETVFPDRVVFVDEPDQIAESWGEVTGAEFARRARNQAAHLDALGIGVGERVAIISQNSARLACGFFGVSGWGRVYVPVNFRLSPAEVAYIVDHCGATVLLYDPELADTVADLDVAHKVMLGTDSDVEWFFTDGEPAPWEPDEDATATINYTSGTTARPKGVEQTHRSLWLNASTFGWHAGVNERDVYLHTLPMFHCNGWGMVYASLGMGVKQVVLRKVDGAEILRRIDRHGVTFACAAPAVVAAALEAAPEFDPVPGRDRMRVIVAGAPPPTQTIERVEAELGWEFIQIYGLTETAPLMTMNRCRSEWDDLAPSERASNLAAAGSPTIGMRVSVDAYGEVLARGNHVLEGYWAQPEATAAAIVDGWFHTGDGGTVEGGVVTISDRKKDVIISGGENVSSIEVEDAVFSHPEVAEVAVIGVPSDKWGETGMALVVRTDGSTLTEEALIAHTRQRLAGYKCPKTIEFREELVRTATGKLQKFKLRAPYWEGLDRQVN